MSFLSAVAAWFKRTFGRATPNPPTDYRRATKSELRKMGVSEKSERYIKKAAKRITKRTKSISSRAYKTAKLTAREKKPTTLITPEKASKKNKPKIRKLPVGEKMEATYPLPFGYEGWRAKAEKLISKLRAQYTSIDPRATGAFILVLNDGRGETLQTTFLKEINLDDVFPEMDADDEDDDDGSGEVVDRASKYISKISDIKSLYLQIRYAP